MSAPAFTPAPWLRETNLVYALDADGTVNRFSAAVSGGFTSYRDQTHTTLDEQEANARLIASAPELYRSLAELLDLVVTHGLEPCRDFAAHEFDAIVDGAVIDSRRALAKARGE